MRIVLFLIVCVLTKVGTKFVDLVRQIVEGDGEWILAAAGTTGIPPPWESCVTVKITDTRRKSDCVVMYHNHVYSKTRILFYLGLNEENITEIRSRGPTHQFMIKTTEENRGKLATPAAFRDEVDYYAVVNNALCWYGSEDKPVDWRYIVMPLTMKDPIDIFFLIGVRARLQAPEYQIAIFSKGKLDQTYIKHHMDIINHRNSQYFKKYCLADTDRDSGYWFPPYCLPKVYMKCAVGYRIWDLRHPYNIEKASEDEILQINEKQRSTRRDDYRFEQTSTIWVNYQ